MLSQAFRRPKINYAAITFQEQKPSWLADARNRRFASVATTATFLVAFGIVVATSTFTLVVAPRSDAAYEGLDQQHAESTQCVRVARRAHYTVAFVGIGSPVQYLSLLLRLDTTVDNDAESVDIFSSRLLKSISLVCNETEAETATVPHTTCRDLAIVYNGTEEQTYGQTHFGFSNDYVKSASGNRASMLDLDGEMFLVHGYTYWLTTTHLCWSPLGTSTPSEEADVLHFSKAMTVQPNELLAFPPLRDTPAAAATSGPCENTSTPNAVLFPLDAALERSVWLVLGSSFLFEFDNKILDQRRHIIEIGANCSDLLDELQQVKSLYKIDCLHALTHQCRDVPSVPYRRLAQHRLRFDVEADGSGELRAEKTPSLANIPQLSNFSAGLSAAFGRLIVMILTAAVVFVRGTQNASSSKYMLEHCLDVVHCRQVIEDRILKFKRWEVFTDCIITLVALASRVWVFFNIFSVLLAGTHGLVIFYQVFGIAASLVHVLLRYVFLEINLEMETPLTKLAGPMSIVDVSAAVLMSFAEPPLLATHDGRFAAVGRLLIGILISITVFSRCVFASSICALMASTVTNSPNYQRRNERGDKVGNQGFQSVLCFSAGLWIVQTVSISGTFAALFVQPAAFSLTRMITGDVAVFRFCILAGFLATGLPTINKVGLRTLEHACDTSEARDEARRHAH